MQVDEARETAAVEDAAALLLGMADRIAALAAIEWHSPAALLYRGLVHGIAEDCASIRIRLVAYVPDEW